MSPLLFKHWSDISSSMGALYGLVNFLGLRNLGLSPELSFVSGYVLTHFLNRTVNDTVAQYSAKNISHWVQTFEEQ